jgi:hypothetical protein
MATDEKKEAFLNRWSRMKREQKELPQKKEETPAPTLPPVDKLSPESDFTPFMHPKVEDALRRVALKKLFNDPHFNTPDPFEPFSGDWNVAEPISEELLATLNQAKQHLFSEPKKDEPQPPAEEPKQEVAKPDEPGKQDA